MWHSETVTDIKRQIKQYCAQYNFLTHFIYLFIFSPVYPCTSWHSKIRCSKNYFCSISALKELASNQERRICKCTKTPPWHILANSLLFPIGGGWSKACCWNSLSSLALGDMASGFLGPSQGLAGMFRLQKSFFPQNERKQRLLKESTPGSIYV